MPALRREAGVALAISPSTRMEKRWAIAAEVAHSRFMPKGTLNAQSWTPRASRAFGRRRSAGASLMPQHSGWALTTLVNRKTKKECYEQSRAAAAHPGPSKAACDHFSGEARDEAIEIYQGQKTGMGASLPCGEGIPPASPRQGGRLLTQSPTGNRCARSWAAIEYRGDTPRAQAAPALTAGWQRL